MDSDAPMEASVATTTEPREGSSLYYSLLWIPAGLRRNFLDTLHLIETLATTLDDVQDAGVAEQKVHWWHEELERLTLGTPRHPGTIPCLGTPTASASSQARLLDVLSTAASARFEPATDDADHADRLVRDYRARLALLANALDPAPASQANADPDAVFGLGVNAAGADVRADVRAGTDHDAVGGDVTYLDNLARGLGLRDQLARLPTRLHRGHPVFSNARYARHGLTPSSLARHVRRAAAEPEAPVVGDAAAGSSPALADIPVVTATGDRHAMIAELVDEAHEALQRTLTDADYRQTFRQPRLAPLARLVALRESELRLWQSKRPDLLRERTTPTPLAKFFIAWRHRHGAR